MRYGTLRAPALAVVFALALSPSARAAEAPDLGKQLDAEMAQHFRPDQPGAAVLVRKGDQILLRKGYGLGDVDGRRPVRPEQVFRLGSITKPFTAAAILLLAESGKLSVTDDIRKHLPGYPTGGATITIEHLLTHTSGIPSYTDLPSFRELMAREIEPAALVDQWKDLPLEFPPGARMKYSNSGYHLLGLIIEKVSGLSYAQFIAQRIFAPLQMTHSGYGDDPKLDRVRGYERGRGRGEDGPARPALPINMKIPYSAGALVSSVDDLARWDSAIAAGKLISKDGWQRGFSRARLKDGSTTDYGYGWSLGTIDGRPAHRHGGGIPGFATHFLRVPDQRLLVVVLLNSIPGPFDAGLLTHRLAMIALGKPMADPRVATIAPALLDRYAGTYQIAEKGTFRVNRQADHLTVQPPRGPTLEAWAESDRRFFVKGHPIRFQFAVDPAGAVTSLEITRPNGDIDRATRSAEKSTTPTSVR